MAAPKALAQGAEGAPKQNFLKGAFGGAFGARPSASSWPLITHCPCKFPQPAVGLFWRGPRRGEVEDGVELGLGEAVGGGWCGPRRVAR